MASHAFQLATDMDRPKHMGEDPKDSVATTILREAQELGGSVKCLVVHGMTQENAQQLYAWSTMWGHTCSHPVRSNGKWSVTVSVPQERG